MARYQVHRVGLWSLARFGCVLGGLGIVLPAILCGVFTRLAVGSARGLLEGWQDAHLGFLRFDLVEALGLQGSLAALQALDAAGWLLGLAVAWGLGLGAGLVLALFLAAGGLGYNLLARLTGGLELELQPLTEHREKNAGKSAGAGAGRYPG